MSIRQGTRIAFTGAGGVGKTTTAEFLARELDLPLLKSAARIIYESEDLTENSVLALPDNGKLSLQTRIFDEKFRQDQNFSYVADRTILDHHVYCLAYCGGFMPNSTYLEFEEKVRASMLSTYSHIFYFPWGYWEGESDGVRQNLMSWQSQIDALIAGYCIRWDLPVIEVPQTEGEDVRNEFVKRILLGKEK
jgi:predicted ATPase